MGKDCKKKDLNSEDLKQSRSEVKFLRRKDMEVDFILKSCWCQIGKKIRARTKK